jgi:hypothetical protein
MALFLELIRTRIKTINSTMSPRLTKYELLRNKDSYNRIALQITWTHPRKDGLKFDRLRLDYGDSRTDQRTEMRRLFSDGLKI